MKAVSLENYDHRLLGSTSLGWSPNSVEPNPPYAVHGTNRIADRHVYALAGMPIDAVSLDEALDLIESAVREKRRLFISTPNSNFVAAAARDPEFRRSVQLSDLVVPDGMPLVLFARLLGLPCKGRVTGADLFEQLISGARPRTHIKVFFFGGPPGAALAAHSRLNALEGPVSSVGGISPPYASVSSMSDEGTIAEINSAKPDFILVALGASKGQKWIVENRHRLNASVLVHLGAVVNFTAGNVRRAPRWVQKVGAEWLWRIYQEPSLWRRYGSDGLWLGSVFVRQVLPTRLLSFISGSSKENVTLSVDSQVELKGNDAIVTLHGPWTGHQRARALGHILDEAISHGCCVVVNATHLESIGTECIAQLLLAKPRVPSLRLENARTGIARVVNWCGAGDLLLAQKIGQ